MKLSQEQIQNIIQSFKSGKQQSDVAIEYGVSRACISQLLKRNNIETYSKNRKIALSKEDIDNIVNMYYSKLSLISISEKMGYSTKYIEKVLKSNGVELRDRHDVRKYPLLNEGFFDIVDNEAAAYFLGFMYADGNVSTNSTAIKLKLHKKDTYILKTFSLLIFGDIHLLDAENNKIFQVNSKHMKEQLIKLGCMPNKTFKLEFPDCIPDYLLHHFIRGYIDGDGCISRYKNDFDVSFIGTEKFCIKANTKIATYIGIEGRIKKDKNLIERYNNTITSTLSYKGNRRVEKLLDWLYKDATIFLERKHQKYIDLKQWIAEVDARKALKTFVA